MTQPRLYQVQRDAGRRGAVSSSAGAPQPCCLLSGVAGLLPMLRRRRPIAFNVFVDKLCGCRPMIPLAGCAKSCHAANGSETLGLQGGGAA